MPQDGSLLWLPRGEAMPPCPYSYADERHEWGDKDKVSQKVGRRLITITAIPCECCGLTRILKVEVKDA